MKRTELWRTLDAVGGRALSNTVLLYLMLPTVLGALLMVPLGGFMYAGLLLGALIAVAAVILKVTMGERMVGAAVVSGLSGFGLGVALFAINFPAELTFSFTPLPLVAGVLGAVVAGIALPWNRARVAGWVALIAAIAMVVTPLTIRWQDERRVAALDADDAAQAQFDYEIETAILPTVTEAEGMTLSDVQANDQAGYAWVFTADGGVMGISTYLLFTETVTEEEACWWLLTASMFPQIGAAEPDSELCEMVIPGRWQLTDGTAITALVDGTQVTLSVPDQTTAEGLGATRPATAAEMEEAAAHLRVLTRAEFREYRENAINPDGLPEHGTPGD